MATTQNGPAGADRDGSVEDQVARTPDEDGPHDVPDEQVIEKTVPSKPQGDSGKRPPRP